MRTVVLLLLSISSLVTCQITKEDLDLRPVDTSIIVVENATSYLLNISARLKEIQTTFYREINGTRMVEEINGTSKTGQNLFDCFTYGALHIIEMRIQELPSATVVEKDPIEITRLVEKCVKFQADMVRNDSTYHSINAPLNTLVSVARAYAMFPGTKFCGEGTTGIGIDDFGLLERIDQCCRIRYLCNDTIRPFFEAFGLFNPNVYIMTNCECDKLFNTCLENETIYDPPELLDNRLKREYHNALFRRCFQLDYKLNQCKTLLHIPPYTTKCLEYYRDYLSPKLLQIRDTPFS